MKKGETDILYGIDKVQQRNQLLSQLPKTPQQRFMLNYATIYFLNKGCLLPILEKLLQSRTGATSELLLRLKYMKQCMENRVNLDNKDFHVLNTLVLWMEELDRVSKSQSAKLVTSTLLPHPHQLTFEYYEQFILYLNYLAVDIQNLFKSNTIHWSADDLILFLQISLPRIYFNIILPSELIESEKKEVQVHDLLFCNSSVQYFTRTRLNYRGLCKLVFSTLISMELTSTQSRHLIDIACRYYLLFWTDPRQTASQLFLSAFSKCTEAVRFSLTDELLLFFKVCQKLEANSIEEQLRRKWQWIDSLLTKYQNNVVGHPKDDVNPFNPLNLKQQITIDAGKTVQRVLEIYKDETLFYFTILVGDNDINLRLFYLGDFQSKVEVKKMLHFDEKKSGQNRFAYMAGKRGIYMIQFDNSYSWINSKVITFEYVILTQNSRSFEAPIWLSNLFELNSPPIKRQPVQRTKKLQKIKESERQTIQVSKLEQIYLSTNYDQELQEEDDISLPFDPPKAKVQKQESITPKRAIQGSVNQPLTGKQNRHKELQIKLHEEMSKYISNHNDHNVFSQNARKDLSRKKQTEEKIDLQKEPIKQEILKAQTQISPSKSDPKGEEEFIGQANLSLIDNIFSLLISTYDHTYEFQTNLEDRINKRLRSYCSASQQYQWIINGEARDWLRKNGFSMTMKGGVNYLTSLEKNQMAKRQTSSKSSKQ